MTVIQDFYSNLVNWFRSDSSEFDFFKSLPFEIQTNIVSLNFLADIFSFMQVSNKCYSIGRISLIKKSQSLGYRKSSKEENFDHAAKYLHQIFFKITLEQQRSNLGNLSNFRSHIEAIENEKEIFMPVRQTLTDKLEFIQRLDKPLNNITYIIYSQFKGDHCAFYCEIEKDYIDYFIQHFFQFSIPKKILKKFSFKLAPQCYFRKFEAMLLLASIAAQQKKIFNKLIENHIDSITMNDDSEDEEIDEWYYFTELKDLEGNNLLHIACFVGNIPIVERLCKVRTPELLDCLQSKNHELKTPLDMALSEGHTDIIALIRFGFPNLNIININSLLNYVQKTNHGDLFFEYALNLDKKKLISKGKKIAKGLIHLHNFYPLTHPSFQPANIKLRSIYLNEAVNKNCIKLVKHWTSSSEFQLVNLEEYSLLETAIKSKSDASFYRLIFAGLNLDDSKMIIRVFNLLSGSSKNVNTRFRFLVRSGANLKDLDLDKNALYKNYINDVLLVDHLLNQNLEIELTKKLIHDFSYGLLDGILRLALQGHEKALNFIQDGMILKEKHLIPILHPFLEDLHIAQYDLSDIPFTMQNFVRHCIPATKYENVYYSKKTLLTKAVSSGCLQIVQLLINKEWNINKFDEINFKPLHWAIQRNNETMVKLLLKHGAHVNSDILFFAYKESSPELANLIAEYLKMYE